MVAPKTVQKSGRWVKTRNPKRVAQMRPVYVKGATVAAGAASYAFIKVNWETKLNNPSPTMSPQSPGRGADQKNGTTALTTTAPTKGV